MVLNPNSISESQQNEEYLRQVYLGLFIAFGVLSVIFGFLAAKELGKNKIFDALFVVCLILAIVFLVLCISNYNASQADQALLVAFQNNDSECEAAITAENNTTVPAKKKKYYRNCILKSNKSNQGKIKVTWGNGALSDATWACNDWKQGKCSSSSKCYAEAA